MSEICVNNSNSLCRLCSLEITTNEHFILDESKPDIANQIWECLHIRVLKDDGLPQSVCSPCLTTTQELYTFREVCQQAQIKLKNKLIPPNLSNEQDKPNIKDETSDSPVEEMEASEVLSTDNDDSECQENGTEVVPEVGEPSPEDYVLMKEESFSIDANKVNSANRGKSGVLGDHLVEFNNNSDLRDRDIADTQRVRQELLPPMWDVYEKSTPNESGELLVTHRRYIVSKSGFPCSLCGACFKFDQGVDRGEGSDNGPFNCMFCTKVFPKRSSWKKHQTTHEDLKPFLCRECGKGFNRQDQLSRHLVTHSAVRPFACNSCGRSYARKEHLQRHLNTSPTCIDSNIDIARPFTCPTCMQGFVRREHLVKHSKKVHNVEIPEEEPEPITCSICSKTFTRREHLRRHSAIHLKEEGKMKTDDDEASLPPSPESPPAPVVKKVHIPVKCEICSKTFSRRSHVLRHMKRIHNTTITGEVHRCEVCNKQFGRKYHLERHQLCHVKPEYECVTCGEKFDQSDLLDMHMTNVHGNAAVDNYLWM